MMKNEVWLHTHGLCRCNLHEIEILGSNKDDSGTHYDLISSYACRLLDENNPVEEDDGNEIGEETINMGVFYNGEPIVATSKKWINALKYYPKDILGGIEDRKESHNSKTNILFLYGSEEDFNKNRLRKPTEFTIRCAFDIIYPVPYRFIIKKINNVNVNINRLVSYLYINNVVVRNSVNQVVGADYLKMRIIIPHRYGNISGADAAARRVVIVFQFGMQRYD